jgi:hypothetical protein
VQSLEDRHQVKRAGNARVRDVSGGETDPGVQAGLLGVAAGRADRIGIGVEAVLSVVMRLKVPPARVSQKDTAMG